MCWRGTSSCKLLLEILSKVMKQLVVIVLLQRCSSLWHLSLKNSQFLHLWNHNLLPQNFDLQVHLELSILHLGIIMKETSQQPSQSLQWDHPWWLEFIVKVPMQHQPLKLKMILRRVFQYGLVLLCWMVHWHSCLKLWNTGDMLIPIVLSIPCNSDLNSVSGEIPRLNSRMFCHEHMKRLMLLNSMLYQMGSLRTTYMLFTIKLGILCSRFVMLCWTLIVLLRSQ